MTGDKAGLALVVAAAIVNHEEGEAFAELFVNMLDRTSGETCGMVTEYLDLGRAVTRERRTPRRRPPVANVA